MIIFPCNVGRDELGRRLRRGRVELRPFPEIPIPEFFPRPRRLIPAHDLIFGILAGRAAEAKPVDRDGKTDGMRRDEAKLRADDALTFQPINRYGFDLCHGLFLTKMLCIFADIVTIPIRIGRHLPPFVEGFDHLGPGQVGRLEIHPEQETEHGRGNRAADAEPTMTMHEVGPGPGKKAAAPPEGMEPGPGQLPTVGGRRVKLAAG